MKPSDQIYGLNDTPPVPITLLLGIQHICIISISFVFPVLLIRSMGGSEAQSQFMVSMSMLAGGVGVMAQALYKGPVGSGYLCPSVCGPSFLAASMLCVKTGGLSLVMGMTLFAGVIEGLFSRILEKIRVLFPPEITGVIVAMVGLSVIRVAGKNLFGMEDGIYDAKAAQAGLATLFIMVGLNIWTKGNIKLFCILIGMICGYIIAYALGVLHPEDLHHAMASPLVWFPISLHPGFSFSFAIVIPTIIAMLCSSLKSIGDLTTCQKINDPGWTRPDIPNIKKGILADGIACISAGLFGGMGQSTSSTNIGLSIANGATSRVIAFSIGGLLVLLSFLPKFSAVFAIMPAPVIGATMVFALSFMVVAGFQIVMSRMIDARKTFVIGLSIIFGLMADLMPDAFSHVPEWLAPVFASSLSASTLVAVVLNLIFRIGIKSNAALSLDGMQKTSESIFGFLENQGRAWAARPEIIKKACAAANEYAELLSKKSPGVPLDILAHFDELRLTLTLTHKGEAPALPDKAPETEKLLDHPECFDQLSGYLIRSYADTVRVRHRNGKTQTRLNFDH